MMRLAAIAACALRRVVSGFGLLLAIPLSAYGSSGPDNYGYTAAVIPFAFEDLGVNSVPAVPILDHTDDAATTIPIGFSFTFYGSTYTTVSVSTNGILTFDGTDTSYQPVDISSMSTPQNLKTIAVLWHDWTFQFFGSDQAYYLTSGAPGSRHLTVQWNFAQSATSSSNGTVTFEVKLFEGSNNIEFHYEDATVDGDPSESSGLGSTIGIRDVDGQITGRNVQWSYNAAVLKDLSAIRFTAPAFTIKSITRAMNGSIVLNCTGAPSKPNYIESTTNLATTAFSRLNPNTPVTADANGNFNFTDMSPGTRKFYRVGFP